MLTDYIHHALRQAKFDLPENGRFYGHIWECPGTWGEGATLEECREQIQSVLKDRLIAAFRFEDPLPVIDGVDNNPRPVQAETD